jgi:cytochrome b561
MTILNTQDGYGALTKFFHWLIVGLFAFQFAAANIMLRIDFDETALGLSQATYYNWHKSIGLLALVVAVLRLLVRKSGQLPAWAPTLTTRERRFVHRAEERLRSCSPRHLRGRLRHRRQPGFRPSGRR